jgi:hypothetical protein
MLPVIPSANLYEAPLNHQETDITKKKTNMTKSRTFLKKPKVKHSKSKVNINVDAQTRNTLIHVPDLAPRDKIKS